MISFLSILSFTCFHPSDSILKDFGAFVQRYNAMLKQIPNFPTEIRQIIYDYLFKHIMFMLVEGYSRVKKVSFHI